MTRPSPMYQAEAARLAAHDADRLAELDRAMSQIDPDREWLAEEYAKRLDLRRAVHHRMRRLHDSQRRSAPIIQSARQELAARALFRALGAWLSDWLSPATPTH